ncbi:MAG: hypothetical protein U1F77_12780 [Kiritimatiellia bacterium]
MIAEAVRSRHHDDRRGRKAAGQALKLAVRRAAQRGQPGDDPAALAHDGGVEVAEVMESELEIKTDAATGKATAPLKLEKGGLYRLRVTGTDRFGQTITQQSQVEVSGNAALSSSACSPTARR